MKIIEKVRAALTPRKPVDLLAEHIKSAEEKKSQGQSLLKPTGPVYTPPPGTDMIRVIAYGPCGGGGGGGARTMGGAGEYPGGITWMTTGL